MEKDYNGKEKQAIRFRLYLLLVLVVVGEGVLLYSTITKMTIPLLLVHFTFFFNGLNLGLSKRFLAVLKRFSKKNNEERLNYRFIDTLTFLALFLYLISDRISQSSHSLIMVVAYPVFWGLMSGILIQSRKQLL
ncbi:Uncharacterised protein [Streptococcus constellatus]|uniref:Uncharacterized protein n=1 Tax=Streptococcus constellatus TaxID=76860 RepID=A0A564SBX3_STRCV|nr:hypothetical protein [Streptococcus constellatus]VUW92614.1 Uncharacterised protein [Streptococcus constellatus]VUX11860.1 Uncharacterised protein [Streptococcus gordonii]